MGEWTLQVLVVLLLLFLLGVWHLRDVFVGFLRRDYGDCAANPGPHVPAHCLPRGVSIALSLIGAFALLAFC